MNLSSVFSMRSVVHKLCLLFVLLACFAPLRLGASIYGRGDVIAQTTGIQPLYRNLVKGQAILALAPSINIPA